MNLSNNNCVSGSQTTPINETKCPICYEEFGKIKETNPGKYIDSSGRIIFITQCRHSYHKECLSENYSYSNRCPLCKRTISKKDYYLLDLNKVFGKAIEQIKTHQGYNKKRDEAFFEELLSLKSENETFSEQQMPKIMRLALSYLVKGTPVLNIVKIIHELDIGFPKQELDDVLFKIFLTLDASIQSNEASNYLYEMGARLNASQLGDKIVDYLLSGDNDKLFSFFQLGGDLNQEQLNTALSKAIKLPDNIRYVYLDKLRTKGAKISKQEAKDALLAALSSSAETRIGEVFLYKNLGAELTPQELRDLTLTPTNHSYEYDNTLLFLEWGVELTPEDVKSLISRVLKQPKCFGHRLLEKLLQTNVVVEKQELIAAMRYLLCDSMNVFAIDILALLWKKGIKLEPSEFIKMLTLELNQEKVSNIVFLPIHLLPEHITEIGREELMQVYRISENDVRDMSSLCGVNNILL